jgi:hypothetical protein
MESGALTIKHSTLPEIATLLLWHNNRSKLVKVIGEHEQNTRAACTFEQSVWDLKWGHGCAKWKPTAPPSLGSQVHCVDNIGCRRKPL